MTTKAKKPAKQKAPRVNKRTLWLRAYLDSSNPRTFLNKTESARAAGYNTSNDEYLRHIGCQNSTKLAETINQWLEENGLSENALRIKLLSLFEGQETKIMSLKGEIDTESLPENAQIIASGTTQKFTQQGTPYTERETIIGINVENKELQRRALDMGFKHIGMYAPEKREVTGEGGGPVRHEHELSPEAQGLLDELIGTNESEEK